MDNKYSDSSEKQWQEKTAGYNPLESDIIENLENFLEAQAKSFGLERADVTHTFHMIADTKDPDRLDSMRIVVTSDKLKRMRNESGLIIDTKFKIPERIRARVNEQKKKDYADMRAKKALAAPR